MEFVGILLTFGGYILVYAAVAHGGEFATEPWAGLYADAYSVGTAVADVATALPTQPF